MSGLGEADGVGQFDGSPSRASGGDAGAAVAPDTGGAMLHYIETADPLTASAEWFVGGHDRNEVRSMAQNLLAQGEIGDFLIRELSSESDGFGLVVKTKDGLRNYKIERKLSESGDMAFHLKGTPDEELFPTVSALVYHYATSKLGIVGTRLLLREEDLAQFGKALKENAEQYGIDEYSAKARWFVSGTDRAELKSKLAHMLRNGSDGDFLIRDVASDPGNFGMSLKMEKGRMPNYLIERVWEKGADGKTVGFKMRGAPESEVFSCLAMLVYYYATSKNGVMGYKLRLQPADLQSLREYVQARYPAEFEQLGQIEAGVPTAHAGPDDLSVSPPQPPTSPNASPTQPDSGGFSSIVSQLEQTQKALIQDAPPPSDALLLLYTITFGTSAMASAPSGTSLSISLHGSRGSTSMRPVPVHQAVGLFSPSRTSSVAIVMEDVGRIHKVGLGVHSNGHSDQSIAWGLNFIDIVSSTGDRWRADCNLMFSATVGFYHEVATTTHASGNSLNTAAKDPAGQAKAEVLALQGALTDAKKLKVVRSRQVTTTSLTRATEGVVQDYHQEQTRLQSALLRNQNRTRQIETLQRAANEQTTELNRRLEQLATVFRRAEAEAAHDIEKAHAVDEVIATSNKKMLGQAQKLEVIKERLERARQSTKEDQGVFRQLDDERKRLIKAISDEESRLAKLLKAKENAYTDVLAFKDAVRQKQRQLETTSARLKDTASEIRKYHAQEQRLESSIVRDEHRLQLLEAELLKQRAAESDMRLRGHHADAVARARERAAVERKVRDAARARALRELASKDYSAMVDLPSNFFEPFQASYGDFKTLPPAGAGPNSRATKLQMESAALEAQLEALQTEINEATDVPAPVEVDEGEVYGFEEGDDELGSENEAESEVGLTPLNEELPPPESMPENLGVSKRFAILKDLWNVTADSGSSTTTMARKMKKKLDEQLHEVQGAVFMN